MINRIVAFMSSKVKWEGTPAELYKSLDFKQMAFEDISTKEELLELLSLPKNPIQLSKRLPGIEAELRSKGIVFAIARSKYRKIILLKIRNKTQGQSQTTS
jgi:hypothetical protein